MRWEDERYIRIYTRDTVTWKMLPWQGKALLPLILRKVDRAGILELGDEAPAVAIAAITEMPLELVDAGLPALIARHVIQVSDGVLVAPKFIEAQETPQSDKARQQKSRELARDALSAEHRLKQVLESENSVTKRDDSSRAVTGCHEVSQPVTPNRAVPCLTVPERVAGKKPPANQDEDHSQGEGHSQEQKPEPAKKAPDPRHAPLVASLTEIAQAAVPGWRFRGGRDAKHVTQLLALGEPAEVEARWRRALARDSYPRVRTLSELVQHWNHFATDSPLKATGTDVTRGYVRAETQNHEGKLGF